MSSMRAKHSLTLLLEECIWREVQFMNQIIMQFSVAYCFALRPKYTQYFPEYFVLKSSVCESPIVQGC